MVSHRDGSVAGITLQGVDGAEWFCGAGNYLVQGEMVVVSEKGLLRNYQPAGQPPPAPDRGEILGATVVSEDGRLLGQVSDVIEASLTSHAIYRISRSGMKRLIGDEFWLSNAYRISYLQDRSKDGLRIIAPLEAIYATFNEALCKSSRPGRAELPARTGEPSRLPLPLLLLLALSAAILLSFWPW